jgi:GNAT superfamily N-acetyltransferase
MSVAHQTSELTVRRASPADAAAACHVLRESIAHLCEPDHHGSSEVLNDWLEHKTPLHMRLWICSPLHNIYLARLDDDVVGIAGYSSSGEVTLLYVLPEVRFQGVSKRLLANIESKANAEGFMSLTVISTTTARDFFEKAGYSVEGEPVDGFGSAPSYPMRRSIKHGPRI